MGHRGRRRRSVPMLQARRKPDHVTGAHFFDRTALTLNPAEPRGDDQCLAEGMGMPGAPCTWFECDAARGDAAGFTYREERVNSHGSGKILGRSWAGRL